MKKYFIFSVFLFALWFFPGKVSALNQVNVYFFHWNQCSHCHDENAFLEKIEAQYKNVKVYRYEVTGEKNSALMYSAKELFGQSDGSVPFTVIGDQYFTGYSKAKGIQIEEKIRALSAMNGRYEDKLASLLETTYQTDLEGTLPEEKVIPSEATTPSPSASPSSEKEETRSKGTIGGIILLCFMGIVLASGVVLNILQNRAKKLNK